MGFLKLFKRKNSSRDKVNTNVAAQEKSTNAATKTTTDFTNNNSNNYYSPNNISEPLASDSTIGNDHSNTGLSTDSLASGSTKRRSSFSLLKKPSFGTIDTSISHHTNKEIRAKRVTDLPEELMPVVTLINHQQSRVYYKGHAYFNHASNNLNNYQWTPAYVELSGSDINVQVEGNPNTFINVCDCELSFSKAENTLSISVTNESVLTFKFNTLEEVVAFYSAVLLCKFEYQQLQEAYTGALLSSQAIHFSDIKTLLSPSNKNVKEEWTVIRFPFFNDKCIRAYIVIKPNNKVEIYTSSSKAKKHLLATITNGQSAYTIYSNDPSQIQNNSLLRIYGNCYINSDLLEAVVSNDDIDSIRSKKMRSRTSSLSKRLSMTSLRSDDNSRAQNMHKRTNSNDTTLSNNSFNNSKTPKKLMKKNLTFTQLVYIIPESHASVRPVEIMLRMLIPVLNSFSLYGRPTKFISSRTDPNSLLFGLPQLPNTYYLNTKSANDLVSLNLDHSISEAWTSSDWNYVFKELLGTLMEKGWKGGAFVGDVANLNITLKNKHETPSYDPMEDFADRSSSANRSMSVPE
ncbi:hypothetical protein CANINC_004979 [Pichia inconspicua]|uniref:Skg3/CAF120-like PH-like domain-containing protein n=1 Tax=Pichia inconspicua TaxID=52247 RepID=A0A4T0WUM7_9ASCO|nr:hypothetical protein CANINC_004979 [[Candida] inconspicua]